MLKLSNNYIKLILGLKLKQLRIEQGFSLSDLAKKSGLSVSYLNEIESGKKYPKAEKIAALSSALGTTYDKLVSLKLTKNLAPIGELLESNLLELLPLDHYGIDINKFISLMSDASMQLSALVTTIIEMARGSEMSQNNFSRTALKTYKEFNDNYCAGIETDAEKFISQNKLDVSPPVEYSALKGILENNFHYRIDESSLESYPALSTLRGVYIEKDKKTLVLNNRMKDTQKAFIVGKELAYNIWDTKERSKIHSTFALESFEHLLNNFRASYFANSILLAKNYFLSDLTQFFANTEWSANKLVALINKYNSTPEMFFQRMTNFLSKSLGIKKFFFIRFNSKLNSGTYYLSKELRLNISENPGGYQNDEHYCRRWISIKTLKSLERKIEKNKSYNKYTVDILHSNFSNSQEEYLAIAVAKRRRLIPDELYSVTIGFLIDDNLKEKIKFWNDPKIKKAIVNDTCEMCEIKNCKDRIAPPTSAERKKLIDNAKSELKKLIDEV
jgi:transcriptional regulator with XRE-family HTH domain/predicted transcriptional regulator